MSDITEARMRFLLSLSNGQKPVSKEAVEVQKGDYPGHPFRGNQHTGGKRGASGGKSPYGVKRSREDQEEIRAVRMEASEWKERLGRKGELTRAANRQINDMVREATEDILARPSKPGSPPPKHFAGIQRGELPKMTTAQIKKVPDDLLIRHIGNVANRRMSMVFGDSDRYSKRQMNSFDIKYKQAVAEAARRGLSVPSSVSNPQPNPAMPGTN